MSFVATGVLLLLAVPVISIAALVMTLGVRDRLRRLQQRVAALEAGQAASPISCITRRASAGADRRYAEG